MTWQNAVLCIPETLAFDKLEEKMEEKKPPESHFSRFLCLRKHVKKWVFSVGISASSMVLFWQILTAEKYFSEVCSFVRAAAAALLSTLMVQSLFPT